jgi:hypothetical protein
MSEAKERIPLEDLPQRRTKLAELREQKGKSGEALDEAKKLEGRFHEEVVDLIWEQYLIGKHMVMEAREKAGVVSLPKKVIEMSQGYLIMRSSATGAQEYIEQNDVKAKQPRSGRFLGEVEMLVGYHTKAAEHFEKSISLFEQMDESSDRVNALELSGFLVEALVLGGKVDEGIKIATKTFADYDSGDGQSLKDRDYYTWAVWKSGCATKVWHALLQKGITLQGEDREKLVGMLLESEEILNPPPETKIWGSFDLRKDEVSSIKKKLKLD